MKPHFLSQALINTAPSFSIKVHRVCADKRRRGKDIIVLSSGEAFFKISFKEETLRGGHGYSEPRGFLGLRELISKFYLERFGIESDPEKEVMIGAGSKSLFYFSFVALLNPGDEVIFFEPIYMGYPEQVKLAGGKPVLIPYQKGPGLLAEYVTKKTKVIVINNPNNPSGKIYQRKELNLIRDFAKKNNLYLISDESYSDFTPDKQFVSLGLLENSKEDIIILNSFSENLGIPGWRLGYVIANKHIIEALSLLQEHITVCPATPLQQYIANHLTDMSAQLKPQLSEMMKLRQEAIKYAEEIGLESIKSFGTFYFCVNIKNSALRSEEFTDKLLNEYGVSAVPGIGFGESFDSYIRISLGAESLPRIKKGLLIIKNLIDETG